MFGSFKPGIALLISKNERRDYLFLSRHQIPLIRFHDYLTESWALAAILEFMNWRIGTSLVVEK
jgi:hypothetical protein